MSDDDTISIDDDMRDTSLHAHSYTGVFKIERRIRKINDFYVPLRGGLVPAQVGTFVVVLLVCAALWFALFNPLLHMLFGDQSTVMIAIFAILGPALLAAHYIGKPMPDGKTIKGLLRGRLRRYLDDEWHKGGMPIRQRRNPTEKVLHIQRPWSPDGEGAAYIADVVGKTDLYTPAPIPASPADLLATRRAVADTTPDRLLSWVTDVETTDAETRRAAAEDSDNEDALFAAARGSYGSVLAD